MTKPETAQRAQFSQFVIRASSFIRHLSFVLCHLLCNFNCQLERGNRFKPGNARLASSPCAFDERRELTLERLLARDLDFVARNPSSRAPVDFAALILIIQREISVPLKISNLAHPLGTGAAGGNVRDAAILETHPRVRDVFAAA